MDSIYLVTAVKQVNTKFGPRITIDIENECFVFLPPRMVKVFNEDEQLLLDQLKDMCNKVQLGFKYLGGEYNLFEFVKA